MTASHYLLRDRILLTPFDFKALLKLFSDNNIIFPRRIIFLSIFFLIIFILNFATLFLQKRYIPASGNLITKQVDPIF
jgi:uncharacterized membrane protein (DUF485 family)